MISELYHTENWGALVEEMMEVYRQGLMDELIIEDDADMTRELQIKVRQVPEILNYLREMAKRAGAGPQPKAKPKGGY